VNRIQAQTINPVLRLDSAKAIMALPPAVRSTLRGLLNELSRDAGERAEHSWRKKKGPMAAYWKATSVYAKHIARALASQEPIEAAAPSGEVSR
jgi:hypothetical protein